MIHIVANNFPTNEASQEFGLPMKLFHSKFHFLIAIFFTGGLNWLSPPSFLKFKPHLV